MFRPFQCHFCVCLDGTFMFSATNQVKQLKISGFRVFALWVGYFGQKKHFFLFLILIGPNHSEMVPNGKKHCQTPLLDHLGPFLSDLDQKWKKWVFHQKWPTHRAIVIFSLISAIPERPRQPGPIFLAQNGLYICPTHRYICFMLNSHL